MEISALLLSRRLDGGWLGGRWEWRRGRKVTKHSLLIQFFKYSYGVVDSVKFDFQFKKHSKIHVLAQKRNLNLLKPRKYCAVTSKFISSSARKKEGERRGRAMYCLSHFELYRLQTWFRNFCVALIMNYVSICYFMIKRLKFVFAAVLPVCHVCYGEVVKDNCCNSMR